MQAISSEKGDFFICSVISRQESEDKDYQYGTHILSNELGLDDDDKNEMSRMKNC